MAYAVATYSEPAPFDSISSAIDAFRRAVARGIAMSLGAAAAGTMTAAFLTVTAAWFVAAAFSVNPHLAAKAPHGATHLAFGARPRLEIAAGELAGPVEGPATASLDDEEISGEPPALSAPKYVLASVAPMVPANTFQSANYVTVSDDDDEMTPPAMRDSANIAIAPSDEQSGREDTITTASITPRDLPPKRPAAGEIWLRDVDSRTAVYDIASHTVYMPDGTELEAHSGLGSLRDDPTHIRKKNRGPTPPNVYNLKLRESLFHGVRAIRLNPTPGSTMFGRDGILAHTYMLGSSGQSNGCVSFKNYNAFLKAFLRGEVTRMVVVPRLGTTDMAQLRNAQRTAVQ